VIAFAAAALSYLLGSLPFSWLVARARGVTDLRGVGSGNVGATNVARSAGPAAGLFALAFDAGKGALAVLLVGQLFPGRPAVTALAAVSAVLGHVFPFWLRFGGGKGVATGLGAFAALVPEASLAALLVFSVAAAVSRHVAIGSIAGALTLPAVGFALHGAGPAVWAAAATAVLVVLRHRPNLRRMLDERAARRRACAGQGESR
jgi:glycerol-3-phosphate acyltransferase PlsY